MKKISAVMSLLLASTLAFALEGDPIPGVPVMVGRKPPGGNNILAQGTSDAQGSYIFKDLPDGTFFVRFKLKGKSYEVFENATGDPVRVVNGPRTSRMAETPVVTTKTFGGTIVTIEVVGNTLKAAIAKKKNASQTEKR